MNYDNQLASEGPSANDEDELQHPVFEEEGNNEFYPFADKSSRAHLEAHQSRPRSANVKGGGTGGGTPS